MGRAPRPSCSPPRARLPPRRRPQRRTSRTRIRRLPVADPGRRPARPDDAGREDRPDDPGRAGRRSPPRDITPVPARLGAVRRRLGARAEHRRPAGPTCSTASSTPRWPRRCGIPLIYGVDAVHGHNNVVGATIFPHNIGLGATRDPALVQQIGRATAEEVAGTGIDWDFAPCLCVARDDRWGRTYESFGEKPELADVDGHGHHRAAGQHARRPGVGAGHRQALRRRRRHRPAASTRATPRSPRPSCARSTCRRSRRRSGAASAR